MDFLDAFCTQFELNNAILAQCQPFSCGDADLDDFFLNDADNYSRQMLGKSYCYRLDADPSVIVCAFTLANASVDVWHLPNSRKKKLAELIPHEKHLTSYPAYLACRLGVSIFFRGKGIGTNLMNNIKLWVMKPDTKGGCRFVSVDAYNNERTRRYYENNGFKYLFSTEQQEKDYLGMPPEKELKTRLMYYDLMLLSDKM
ncbi:MAG: GNAT family N-acetyltransferase [Prevotellaceae bacterium]|jgi:GNAT superfamily N-acetyltransferase|nr:GNAT family N-acetyltransferase [Prevotellaceae bacterium]